MVRKAAPTDSIALSGDAEIGGLAAAPEPLFHADLDQGYVIPENETFANAAPNPIKVTAEDPVSTFSTDVDTASWSVLRNSLERGARARGSCISVCRARLWWTACR